MLSETNSPEFIIDEISDPNYVLFLISSRKRSPVDNWYRLNLFAINFDWVPLPAPGGPKITMFIIYLLNLAFLINDSYWELINLVWTCVTVSIATTTTISTDVPPK